MLPLSEIRVKDEDFKKREHELKTHNFLIRRMRILWLWIDWEEKWMSFDCLSLLKKNEAIPSSFCNRRRQSKIPIWATKSIHIEFFMCPSQEGGFIGLTPRHQFFYSMGKGNHMVCCEHFVSTLHFSSNKYSYHSTYSESHISFCLVQSNMAGCGWNI